MAVQLSDKESGHPIFTVTDEQFDFLAAALEEESTTDTDYYIDEATIEMLETDGADEELLDVLRSILADREGVEVNWERDGRGG